MRFKIIERGKSGYLLLVPGWASDFRIFQDIDVEYNYILVDEPSLEIFSDMVASFLKDKKISSLSILGWSLGGFLACDFACNHPNMVKELILIGIRKRYDKSGISKIKEMIGANKKAYLRKFYGASIDHKKLSVYYSELMKNYCANLDSEYLIATLEYLSNSTIDPEKLKQIKKILIIHGTGDAIAAICEAKDIADKLPQAVFIPVEGAGHIPFLESRISW